MASRQSAGGPLLHSKQPVVDLQTLQCLPSEALLSLREPSVQLACLGCAVADESNKDQCRALPQALVSDDGLEDLVREFRLLLSASRRIQEGQSDPVGSEAAVASYGSICGC